MTDAKERSVNIISNKLYLCALDVEGLLSVSTLNSIRNLKKENFPIIYFREQLSLWFTTNIQQKYVKL